MANVFGKRLEFFNYSEKPLQILVEAGGVEPPSLAE